MADRIVTLILLVCMSAAAGSVFDTAKAMSSGILYSLPQLNSSKERSAETTDDVFAKVRNQLKQQTQIPPRLPDLALAYKNVSGLYAILEKADSNHYFIQVALAEDCPDGTNCHVGNVIGSTEPIPVKDGAQIPVTLGSGIRAFFVEADCGAHCDDSSINWKEGQYYYSMTFKAEKKYIMVKLANSAIGRSTGR